MVLYSVGAPERVIPKPTGEVKTEPKSKLVGNVAYETVCEITITKGRTFHPAKITASSLTDFWVKLCFDGEDISVEYYVGVGVPFTNWFPWGWHPCVGDGTKKVELKARSETAVSTTVFGEICGEEV